MIELGNKIRKLRRERGLTQEQFACSLSISPQAVSKWEMGGGYPDISMIPIIANYFDVSLDELFDFDITKKAQKIETIILEAHEYFWRDLEKAEKIYLDGIKEFPSSEKLKTELLSLYECHIRAYSKNELFEKAEKLARKLIIELTDIFSVCSVKADLASLYKMNGKYDEAKTLVDSLPYMYPYMLNDRMRCASYLLYGHDRLEGTKEWKVIETQELFIACGLEGDGYYEIGEYENALKSYKEAIDIVERFMFENKKGFHAYPIGGTDSNHVYYYLGIAGCHNKLNDIENCKFAIQKALDILVPSLGDRWEINRKDFFENFKKTYVDFSLEEYLPFEDLYKENNISEYFKM